MWIPPLWTDYVTEEFHKWNLFSRSSESSSQGEFTSAFFFETSPPEGKTEVAWINWWSHHHLRTHSAPKWCSVKWINESIRTCWRLRDISADHDSWNTLENSHQIKCINLSCEQNPIRLYSYHAKAILRAQRGKKSEARRRNVSKSTNMRWTRDYFTIWN